MKKSLYFILTIILLYACENKTVDDVLTFDFNRNITLDYSDSYLNGFKIPGDDKFFEIKFNTKELKGKYYKIYYQNESYKFTEDDSLSCENFYGSWEDTNIGFKKITEDNTLIKFRIIGNPRNEEQYFSNKRIFASKEEIEGIYEKINKDTKWQKSIKIKAEKNNISFKEQLYIDAKWQVANSKGELFGNNRWQRNLRVGNYSLLLVIVDSLQLANIPKYISNISFKNDSLQYVNPYSYFYSENVDSEIEKYRVDSFVTVKAVLPIQNGIYINYTEKEFDTRQYLNEYVNDNDKLFKSAAFEYYGTSRMIKDSIMNIPVYANFIKGNYTKEQYEKNKLKYDSNRVETYFKNSSSPGKTIGYNKDKNVLWFKNPGNKKGEFIKEDVGVKTRHGFTYGKYTFKINMSELLTKDNVWTGITNAIWLINESKDSWNKRRICKKEGYMPYYGAGEGEERVPEISYSEIDFEILKTVEVWPKYSYKDQKERFDPKSHDNKVMIACTNWDMACMQPDSFNVGVRKIKYIDKVFNIHRWDNYYNALTLKTPISDDEAFGGEYYYFQIEWKPKEIIWRVGPEKDKLKIVGYMDDKVTMIPNNQMKIIITQEYHLSKWWPNSPYNQEDIPFNLDDLEGELYSIEIE